MFHAAHSIAAHSLLHTRGSAGDSSVGAFWGRWQSGQGKGKGVGQPGRRGEGDKGSGG
jgi:hypothetical protein